MKYLSFWESLLIVGAYGIGFVWLAVIFGGLFWFFFISGFPIILKVIIFALMVK